MFMKHSSYLISRIFFVTDVKFVKSEVIYVLMYSNSTVTNFINFIHWYYLNVTQIVQITQLIKIHMYNI